MGYWKSVKNFFLKTKLNTFSVIAIITYSSLQLVIMLLRTKVPDEDWFLLVGQGVADLVVIRGLITVVAEQTNLLGYGAIYWIVFGLAQLTPEAFLVMRGLAWLAVILIPLTILVRGLIINSRYTGFAIVLWLIMPVAWWSGKLIGPDLYVLAIAAVGLFAMVSQQRRLILFGWVIVGVALGIKLNVLPLLVYGGFLSLFTMRSWQHKLLYGLGIVTAGAFGFILANPFVLITPELFFETIQQYSAPANYSWGNFKYIISNGAWTWDGIFVGGLFQNSLNSVGLSLFLLFCVVARVPIKVLLAGSVAIIVAVIIFLSNSIFYGWYWFPTLLVLPFMMLEAERSTRRIKILVGVILGLAAVTALPIIYTGYQNHPLEYSITQP